MPSTKEILIAARKKIENRRNWIQRLSACRVDGSHCPPTDSAAVGWCALGAIRSIVGEGAEENVLFEKAYATINAVSDSRFIAGFNDTSTHEQVLALFDKAIANAD